MFFPFHKQPEGIDDGFTCLQMIAHYYGRFYPLEKLWKLTSAQRADISFEDIAEVAKKMRFKTVAVKTDWERLEKDLPLPCIAHWRENHFIVVYKVRKKFVFVADPISGKFKISAEDFKEGWLNTIQNEKKVGVLLLFERKLSFYLSNNDIVNSLLLLKNLLAYFKPTKKGYF